MLAFIFLPASIVSAYFALENVLNVQKGCKAKLKWILISLILYLPTIVVTTLLGIVYVIYAGCRKIIDPGWTETNLKLPKFNREFRSGELRMCEILFESNPQAILGIAIKNDLIVILFVFCFAGQFILIARGPSKGNFNVFIQYLGVAASIASVTKGTAQWHLFNNLTKEQLEKIPNKILELVKSFVFFFPHILFRLSSLAFIFSFLRYYSLIPLAAFMFLNFLVYVCIIGNMTQGKYDLFASLPFTTLAMTAALPRRKESRLWLKRSILLATVFGLLCLLVIRLLPLLVPHSSIKSTAGLTHLRFDNSSQVFHGSQEEEDFLSHEEFSSTWFPALFVLGTVCLVDGEI